MTIKLVTRVKFVYFQRSLNKQLCKERYCSQLSFDLGMSIGFYVLVMLVCHVDSCMFYPTLLNRQAEVDLA